MTKHSKGGLTSRTGHGAYNVVITTESTEGMRQGLTRVDRAEDPADAYHKAHTKMLLKGTVIRVLIVFVGVGAMLLFTVLLGGA